MSKYKQLWVQSIPTSKYATRKRGEFPGAELIRFRLECNSTPFLPSTFPRMSFISCFGFVNYALIAAVSCDKMMRPKHAA